jgi:hypothetical protein
MAALREAERPERREADVRREVRAEVLVLERLERSENLHVEELYNRISAERAFALRQAETAIFLEALRELVPDREVQARVRRRVATKFAELAGLGNRAAVDAGGGPAAELAAGDPAADDAGGAEGVPGDAGAVVPGRAGVPEP